MNEQTFAVDDRVLIDGQVPGRITDFAWSGLYRCAIVLVDSEFGIWGKYGKINKETYVQVVVVHPSNLYHEDAQEAA